MTPEDLALRRQTYADVVTLGRVPTAAETAAGTGRTEAEVLAGWRRLATEHALVLDPAGERIVMANPFSAVPTAFRVRADERWWYANCAWDAFGVCVVLGGSGVIETSCADCAEPVTLTVSPAGHTPSDLLFHVLVPARHWWDDIGFT